MFACIAVDFAALTHVGRAAEAKGAALGGAVYVAAARLHAVLEVTAPLVVAAPAEALVVALAEVLDDLAALVADATGHTFAPRAAPAGLLAVLVEAALLPEGIGRLRRRCTRRNIVSRAAELYR